MENFKVLLARLSMVCVLVPTMLAAVSCSDNEENGFTPELSLGITECALTGTITVTVGKPATIVGIGFIQGDQIIFRNASGVDFVTEENTAYSNYIEFYADPDAIPADDYTVIARRSNDFQFLGEATLKYRIEPADVPEKDGMNIRGMVYSGADGISGVVVSDGYEFAVTDENGYYYLESSKYHGYVFINIPSGFMPDMDGAFPKFWSTLETKSVGVNEQHNFHLNQVDNTNHIMLFTADLHLCDRNDDIANYKSMVVTGIEDHVSKIGETPVYCMSLGDMSWDTYWVTNGFSIENYADLARDFPVPLFHTMGNHDNDPNETGDFNSEVAYKASIGPNYYSMTIGDVHYVVLDNIVNLSHNSYYCNVTQEQYDWLVKDLSYVTDKSMPLVVCMHSQTYTVTNIDDNGNITVGKRYNGTGVGSATLASAWADFDDVTIMSGHAHINRYVPKGRIDEAPNTRELNMGATGGTWWWTTTFYPLILCQDGSPGGFMRMDFNGKNQKWKYNGVNFEEDYQFRIFDLNMVKNFYQFNAEAVAYLAADEDKVGEDPDDFSWAADNGILVNVFAMDENWNVTVEEEIDGTWKNLDYIYKMARDPLHNICYDIPRFIDYGSINTSFRTIETPHMIYAVAENVDSRVRVTATDPFGETYSQIITRPRDLTVFMD